MLFVSVLLMLFLPAAASAADGVVHPVSDPASLTAALSSSNSGDTILLLRNIEYNSGIVIDGKYISFDLNGCTLEVTNASGQGLVVINSGEVGLTGDGEFNVSRL